MVYGPHQEFWMANMEIALERRSRNKEIETSNADAYEAPALLTCWL